MAGERLRFGDAGLVRWQGRGNRRARRGVSLWTWICAVCAVAGAALMAAQMAGALHWTGAAAAAPAGLMLAAISLQLLAVARAVLAWLAG